jgi:hypothetical protein
MSEGDKAMRRTRLLAVAMAVTLVGAVAGGVAYATIPGQGNVYSACMLKGVGTIRLIDKSLPESNLMSRCKPSLETEVSWNQAGQQGLSGPKGETGAAGARGADGADGADGVGVTSDVEPAGANCAGGGSRFTAANGVTYACNAAPGTGVAGWKLGGNAGTNPGTDFLGTTDGQPLELRVDGRRALRLETGPDPEGETPNLIGGSVGNAAEFSASGATIGGGGGTSVQHRNLVSGSFGTVAGGHANAAAASAAVGGGEGNRASGEHSTIPGGSFNTALGETSFAAGHRAVTLHAGAFVWSDATEATLVSARANEFAARATGGVRFVTGVDASGTPSSGVSLAAGSGSWSSLSDRNLKRDFAPIDGTWVLDRIAALPISSWSYEAQKPSIRHLGPTAQDFRRAFGLGVDKRHIDSIDSEGVSLAGVQALYELARAQQREIDGLKRQVAHLQAG